MNMTGSVQELRTKRVQHSYFSKLVIHKVSVTCVEIIFFGSIRQCDKNYIISTVSAFKDADATLLHNEGITIESIEEPVVFGTSIITGLIDIVPGQARTGNGKEYF